MPIDGIRKMCYFCIERSPYGGWLPVIHRLFFSAHIIEQQTMVHRWSAVWTTAHSASGWSKQIRSSGGPDMKNPRLYEKEFQFCLILWDHEPVSLRELTYLCKDDLGWERSTTYTIIQRLINKGIIQRSGKIVTAVLSKEQVQDDRTEDLIQKTFGCRLSDLFLSLSRLVTCHIDQND